MELNLPTNDAPKYVVVFASKLDRNIAADPGTIIMAPGSDSWNDFGLKIHVDIMILPLLGDGPGMKAFTTGYLGSAVHTLEHGDTRELSDLLQRDGLDTILVEKLPSYFTMLPDMQAYRKLVAEFGPHETQLILAALHDVVAAELRSPVETWLSSAKESPVFLKGFLRSSESYFAWKNAGSILQGEKFEEIGRISETLQIKFQLDGRPNAHEIDFRFELHEPVLPKRFAVIIGKNGVGKSQALGRIAKSALRGSGELTDGEGRRPELNRLLVFYPTTAHASAFPHQSRSGARIWYRKFSLSSAGSGRNRETTSDLIVQLARSTERFRGSDRMDIFLKALLAIEGHEDLALKCRGNTTSFVPILDLLSGGESSRLDRFASVDTRKEPVRVRGRRGYGLSSGELAFVRFAALASLFIENSSLLLFDEPETHLHPNFISQFVILLDNLLEQTGSAAIIATHSAYFVREAFEDQVRILRSGRLQEISVVAPRLKTFGADVGTISYFVFGEDEPSRLAKLVENRIADKSANWDTVFAKYKDQLSLDLLSEIRAQIEDKNPSEKGR